MITESPSNHDDLEKLSVSDLLKRINQELFNGAILALAGLAALKLLV